ncbi:MAG: histidine kinase N-terminal 7TM domain-containing protein [Anaerolineaceae bacterium]
MPNILPNQTIMIVTTILSIMVLIVGWPRRHGTGGYYFIGYCVTLIIWLMGATLEAFVTTLDAKIFWSQTLYIGFVQVVPFLVMFIVSYTQQKSIPIPVVLSLMVIPLITIIMAWTNPLHGWLWSGFSEVSPETNIAIFYHGIWFWVHTIYLYLLMFVGLMYLIKSIAGASPLFRLQLTPILIGVLFPIISGTLYAFNLVPLQGLDITPTGYAFTGLFLAWCLIRYRILDIVPVARTTLVEQLLEGVIVLDVKGNIVDLNKSAEKMVNLDSRNVLGTDYRSALPYLGEIASFLGDQQQKEIHPPGSDGIVLEILITKLVDQSKEVNGMILVIRDVTSRKRAEADLQKANARLQVQLKEIKLLQSKLEQQALHDSLTGLYNRHIFEILDKELFSAKRDAKPVSLAIIDIDNFKMINDKFGHHQGDLLLKEFSASLVSTIRHEDYAARYGGDEIILFFPGMSLKDAQIKAEEIKSGFERFYVPSGNQEMRTTLTIGLATFPQHGQNIEELFKAADRALYLAKEEGRNRVKTA